MFRYRRVRVLTVLLSGWVALTAVERWGEQAPWPDAALSGLLWACVVAGVWWFAEWTQSPLSTAREAAARKAAARAAARPQGEAPHGRETNTEEPVTGPPGTTTPSRH
ncbi:MAG TPA: hypothetical protein VN520_32135 [Streptomyces sp.]|uniref:hypothetical protein n=1 Tax=Streptomyces sp. TaxID=1931 RepID=UPI002C1E4D13|nr:hypothetical protein [Streptomyces sp.]HWU10952.1 hypothetical protein [Streptomyces sp.]